MDSDQQITDEFRAWIRGESFSCVAARASVRRDELTVAVYPWASAGTSAQLYADLLVFLRQQVGAQNSFSSFAAVFTGAGPLSEAGFENALWQRLRQLHRLDVAAGQAWPAGYSDDPASARFAFGLGSHAFFVAGMNPAASRTSRRFSRPVLVFNSHPQFERLKANGVYQGLQRRIRQREIRLQGSINPMLTDHGEASEAAQYSGREVGPQWRCPFPAND